MTYEVGTNSISLTKTLLIGPKKPLSFGRAPVKLPFQLHTPELPPSPFLLVPHRIHSKRRGNKYVVILASSEFFTACIKTPYCSWAKLTKLSSDFLKGLQVIQNTGLVHGDLSPYNIVVFEDEIAPRGALIDLDTLRAPGLSPRYSQTATFLSPRQRKFLLHHLKSCCGLRMETWYTYKPEPEETPHPPLDILQEDEIATAGLCLALNYFAQKDFLTKSQQKRYQQVIAIMTGYAPLPEDAPSESSATPLSNEERALVRFRKFIRRIDLSLSSPEMPIIPPHKGALQQAITLLESPLPPDSMKRGSCVSQ